ncbi:MAG: hypothetical protein AAGI44_16455, partial [Pseudomonadota bacterium]
MGSIVTGEALNTCQAGGFCSVRVGTDVIRAIARTAINSRDVLLLIEEDGSAWAACRSGSGGVLNQETTQLIKSRPTKQKKKKTKAACYYLVEVESDTAQQFWLAGHKSQSELLFTVPHAQILTRPTKNDHTFNKALPTIVEGSAIVWNDFQNLLSANNFRSADDRYTYHEIYTRSAGRRALQAKEFYQVNQVEIVKPNELPGSLEVGDRIFRANYQNTEDDDESHFIDHGEVQTFPNLVVAVGSVRENPKDYCEYPETPAPVTYDLLATYSQWEYDLTAVDEDTGEALLFSSAPCPGNLGEYECFFGSNRLPVTVSAAALDNVVLQPPRRTEIEGSIRQTYEVGLPPDFSIEEAFAANWAFEYGKHDNPLWVCDHVAARETIYVGSTNATPTILAVIDASYEFVQLPPEFGTHTCSDGSIAPLEALKITHRVYEVKFAFQEQGRMPDTPNDEAWEKVAEYIQEPGEPPPPEEPPEDDGSFPGSDNPPGNTDDLPGTKYYHIGIPPNSSRIRSNTKTFPNLLRGRGKGPSAGSQPQYCQVWNSPHHFVGNNYTTAGGWSASLISADLTLEGVGWEYIDYLPGEYTLVAEGEGPLTRFKVTGAHPTSVCGNPQEFSAHTEYGNRSNYIAFRGLLEFRVVAQSSNGSDAHQYWTSRDAPGWIDQDGWAWYSSADITARATKVVIELEYFLTYKGLPSWNERYKDYTILQTYHVEPPEEPLPPGEGTPPPEEPAPPPDCQEPPPPRNPPRPSEDPFTGRKYTFKWWSEGWRPIGEGGRMIGPWRNYPKGDLIYKAEDIGFHDTPLRMTVQVLRDYTSETSTNRTVVHHFNRPVVFTEYEASSYNHLSLPKENTGDRIQPRRRIFTSTEFPNRMPSGNSS